MKITRKNAQELETHRWYIDASELGIAPGAAYPAQIDTDLGNGRPFIFVKFDGNQTAIYEQEFGALHLKVWND
jgi:hypothetical protein